MKRVATMMQRIRLFARYGLLNPYQDIVETGEQVLKLTAQTEYMGLGGVSAQKTK